MPHGSWPQDNQTTPFAFYRSNDLIVTSDYIVQSLLVNVFKVLINIIFTGWCPQLYQQA